MSDKLAVHIDMLSDPGEPPAERRMGGGSPKRVADAIRKDPQAHIDALVEVGVLRRETNRTCYHVVQFEPPHEHEWQVASSLGLGKQVLVCCNCGMSSVVPNRLPIEVPE